MKDIKGYEGRYAITSCGRVWSHISQRFLKPAEWGRKGSGYKRVTLTNANGEQKHHLIHRLVAEAYIPNPNNLPQINHIDENPSHNWVGNLEWCDNYYNETYNNRMERLNEKLREKRAKISA